MEFPDHGSNLTTPASRLWKTAFAIFSEVFSRRSPRALNAAPA
jgi:hypothetical protein